MSSMPRIARNEWTPRRRTRSLRVDTPFVPVASTVHAIRSVRSQFAEGARTVVLHGPSGSGRSTIAQRIGQLWNGTVEVRHAAEIENGSPVDLNSEKRLRKNSKRPALTIVDDLTLRHADLDIADALADRGRESTLLIVSTTAWWLENRRLGDDRSISVPARLLEPEEIGHLVNGLRWSHDPKAPPVDDRVLDEIVELSEGRIAEAVRLASPPRQSIM